MIDEVDFFSLQDKLKQKKIKKKIFRTEKNVGVRLNEHLKTISDHL